MELIEISLSPGLVGWLVAYLGIAPEQAASRPGECGKAGSRPQNAGVSGCSGGQGIHNEGRNLAAAAKSLDSCTPQTGILAASREFRGAEIPLTACPPEEVLDEVIGPRNRRPFTT